MAISTMAALSAALSGPDQDINVILTGSVTASAWVHINRAMAANNPYGTMPIPNSRSLGGNIQADTFLGYPSIVNPDSGKTLSIGKISLVSNLVGTLAIYDRIWACGAFDGASTVTQTVNSFPGLPVAPSTRAQNDGEGLELWLECYTATGSTQSVIQIVYTNSAGVSRVVASDTLPANFPANRMMRIRLADGDTGVKSVESLQLAVSTGTSGNLGLTLMQRKCMVPFPAANIPVTLDFAALGLPPIDSATALSFVFQSNTSATLYGVGTINLVSG